MKQLSGGHLERGRVATPGHMKLALAPLVLAMLAGGHVSRAGTDSTASHASPASDTSILWHFDTGG
jgi:hypothetical protein